MRRIILLMLGLYLPIGISFANASELKDTGRPIDIKVEIGKVTEIAFPSKIAKIVKGGLGESILVEVLGKSIYVLPKSEPVADIFVTTVAGSSYPLEFHLAKERDIKIQLEASNSSVNTSANGFYSDQMDLMKDLLLDKEPLGASVLPADGKLSISQEQIQIKVQKAYELVDCKAYVLLANNVSANAVIVPIEQIRMPNLLAITTKRDMLSAKGQEGDTTQIYMIIGK